MEEPSYFIEISAKGTSPKLFQKIFHTKRQSHSTIPIGYADGLPRRLSNNMEVLVKGRRVPQVGTICMDMILIDVSKVPDVQIGDEVVIFGKQGEEVIPVEELAQKADTIPYEILCNIGKRVPRTYQN